MPDFRVCTKVLLTRSPRVYSASRVNAFDLHALSTPPAFILDQDQILRKKEVISKAIVIIALLTISWNNWDNYKRFIVDYLVFNVPSDSHLRKIIHPSSTLSDFLEMLDGCTNTLFDFK
jgi:hypothetical protein